MMEREIRAVTRPHKLNLGTHSAFRHSVYVRSFTFAVSMETGIRDFYTVCGHLYDRLRDPDIRASITQAAIRDGVAAANAYRTSIENSRDGRPRPSLNSDAQW